MSTNIIIIKTFYQLTFNVVGYDVIIGLNVVALVTGGGVEEDEEVKEKEQAEEEKQNLSLLEQDLHEIF